MTMRRRLYGVVLIAGLIVGGGGCASTSDPVPPTAAMTLPGLAGTWQGTARGSQGLSQPITMRISPDGSYSTEGGVFTARGTAQVKEGRLVLTPASTTGGQAAAGQVGTATLSEVRQPSQVIQVLSGSGAGSAGPFSFEVSRPKQ